VETPGREAAHSFDLEDDQPRRTIRQRRTAHHPRPKANNPRRRQEIPNCGQRGISGCRDAALSRNSREGWSGLEALLPGARRAPRREGGHVVALVVVGVVQRRTEDSSSTDASRSWACLARWLEQQAGLRLVGSPTLTRQPLVGAVGATDRQVEAAFRLGGPHSRGGRRDSASPQRRWAETRPLVEYVERELVLAHLSRHRRGRTLVLAMPLVERRLEVPRLGGARGRGRGPGRDDLGLQDPDGGSRREPPQVRRKARRGSTWRQQPRPARQSSPPAPRPRSSGRFAGHVSLPSCGGVYSSLSFGTRQARSSNSPPTTRRTAAMDAHTDRITRVCGSGTSSWFTKCRAKPR